MAIPIVVPIYNYILLNEIRIKGSGYGDLAYDVLFVIETVISLAIFFGIIIFDNIYMKIYFKKLLLKDNDMIFSRINKMKIENLKYYLNKYKRKEKLLYDNIILKLEEVKIKYT